MINPIKYFKAKRLLNMEFRKLLLIGVFKEELIYMIELASKNNKFKDKFLSSKLYQSIIRLIKYNFVNSNRFDSQEMRVLSTLIYRDYLFLNIPFIEYLYIIYSAADRYLDDLKFISINNRDFINYLRENTTSSHIDDLRSKKDTLNLSWFVYEDIIQLEILNANELVELLNVNNDDIRTDIVNRIKNSRDFNRIFTSLMLYSRKSNFCYCMKHFIKEVDAEFMEKYFYIINQNEYCKAFLNFNKIPVELIIEYDLVSEYLEYSTYEFEDLEYLKKNDQKLDINSILNNNNVSNMVVDNWAKLLEIIDIEEEIEEYKE